LERQVQEALERQVIQDFNIRDFNIPIGENWRDFINRKLAENLAREERLSSVKKLNEYEFFFYIRPENPDRKLNFAGPGNPDYRPDRKTRTTIYCSSADQRPIGMKPLPAPPVPIPLLQH
jgi:hypothetical protein